MTKQSHSVALLGTVEPKREAFKPSSLGVENDTRREWAGLPKEATKSHPRNQNTSSFAVQNFSRFVVAK